jgi:hypothetical protein
MLGTCHINHMLTMAIAAAGISGQHFISGASQAGLKTLKIYTR